MRDVSDIPVLDEDGINFTNYKIKAKKWTITTNVKKSFHAIKLQNRLPEDAFTHTRYLTNEELQSKEGVDILLKKLDELYEPDKLQHRKQLFDKLKYMKRKEDESIIEFINKFMCVFQEYRRLSDKSEYDDSGVALELISACQLNDEDYKIVSAQMAEPPSLLDVKTILKRVFSKAKANTFEASAASTSTTTDNNDSGIFMTQSCNCKCSKTNNHPSLYSKNNRGAYRESRGERPERSRPYRNDDNYRSGGYKSNDGPRTNVRGPDGRHKECNTCGSIYHFFRDCPKYKEFCKWKLEQEWKREQDRKKQDDNDPEICFTY